MRTTIELLELDFVFSQQSPLTISEFIGAFEKRVMRFERQIFLDWEQLEELHRVGVLIPIFRFAKNVRLLLKKARQEKKLATSELGKNTNFAFSYYGTDFGSLIDPYSEHYKSWYSHIHQYKTDYYWRGQLGQEEIGYYWSSSYLYSPYQLLLIPKICKLLVNIKRRRTNRKYSSKRLAYRLNLDTRLQQEIDKAVVENRELTIALTALETKYLPSLKGHRFFARYFVPNSDKDKEEFYAYQKSFDPVKMLEWIGWDANKVKELAQKLLWQADNLDPLRDWYELVRMCHPEMLNKLRGDALIALDHRRAAEILLKFYEDLQVYSAAPPFDEVPKYVFGPHQRRLKYDLGTLDEVLMKFGISPQPALVLIIEGETEDYFFPKVMEVLGIPQYSSYIRIFNSKGVDKDFELLARYVVPLKFGDALEDAVLLTRPPTHFLVAVDAESKFRDSNDHKNIRKNWVDRIHEAVPEEIRTEKMRTDLEHFICIETWDNDVFEFAHFTDDELAHALLKTYQGSERPSLDYLVKETNRVRKRNTNKKIDDVLRKWDFQKKQKNPNYYPGREVGKTDLAIVLWPVIKEKINNSNSKDDLNQIPIVRVLLKADRIARSALGKDLAVRY